jgi:tRNA dimethylallyltransferase
LTECKKTLIALVGPTGVGKTDLSIEIAKYFNTQIISCDSRQIYREMRIGTAVPTDEQLNQVTHHFIHTHSVHDYFNSWQYEQQALELIDKLHGTTDNVLMTGGSMMYVDAVCKGIDDIPTISIDLRQKLLGIYEKDGLPPIIEKLQKLDPIFYEQVDLNNAKRVLHAVEVCMTAGVPYSSLRKNEHKDRGFRIIKIGLYRDRDELYKRINDRVDYMLASGLESEAKELLPLRHLNALNTVGYKEFFDYLNGKIDYEEAVRLIKRNTRRYAKKQMTWFRGDKDIVWFHPTKVNEVIDFLEQKKS